MLRLRINQGDVMQYKTCVDLGVDAVYFRTILYESIF